MSSENDNQDLVCSICYDHGNEEEHTSTLECNHTFHSKCIISWLRQGNTSCPLCRQLEETTHLYPAHYFGCTNKHKCFMSNENWRRCRFKMMQSFAKSKKCPSELKTAFTKYKMALEKFKSFQRQRNIYGKSQEYKTYLAMRKSLLAKRKQYWKYQGQVNLAYERICTMSIEPRKIPIEPSLYSEIMETAHKKLKKKQKTFVRTHRMTLRSATRET